MADPIHAQGADAKKLGLTEYDCPYGPGDNRDKWMSGFGAPKEDVVQEPAAPPPPAPAKEVVRKGAKKKGETEAVTKGTGNAETSLVTATQTADPENSDHLNAEAVIGDPGASTTRAETGGAGITTGVTQEEVLDGKLKDQPNSADAKL